MAYWSKATQHVSESIKFKFTAYWSKTTQHRQVHSHHHKSIWYFQQAKKKRKRKEIHKPPLVDTRKWGKEQIEPNSLYMHQTQGHMVMLESTNGKCLKVQMENGSNDFL